MKPIDTDEKEIIPGIFTGFMPACRLSESTRKLAARYLSGEFGRSMTENRLWMLLEGFDKFHDWNTDWTLAGPVHNNGVSPDGLSAGDLLLDSARSMEEVNRSKDVLPECAHNDHGKMDFNKIFSPAKVHSAAYCFTEVDTTSACMLPIAVDCDWWCSVFVNGQLAYTGSGRPNLMDLPLTAGRNLIGFRITGGSGGWSLSLARGEFSPGDEKRREPNQVKTYAEAVRLIALNAPLRILAGERIAGAATLEDAMRHVVPVMRCSSVSHTTLGFEKALAVGCKGIRMEIEERLSRGGLDESGNELLHAMIYCLDSAKIWHGRYLDGLVRLAGESTGDAGKDYQDVVLSLQHVPENPPGTFREAVQSLWMLWDFQRLCGNWSGIGRIDKMLGPHLRRDLDAGAITIDEARELIAHFWIKGCEWITAKGSGSGDAQFYQNIILSGIDEQGKDVTNEVTYLVLDVVEELHISDFPIAVRISRKTPEKLLRRIAEVQRLGGGIIAVYNEDRIIPNLVKFGYPVGEARNFANDGCWEILVPGKTRFGYMAFDALVILQDVLGLNPPGDGVREYAGFDDMYEAFKTKLAEKIAQMIGNVTTASFTPTVLVDMMIEGCIEKGRSYYNLGPKYTVLSPHAGGLPDVANSLQVIKKLVYEEHEFTLSEFTGMLRNDWAGHEETRRRIRLRFDFYGNDTDESNVMMKKVFDTYTDLVARVPSRNGVLFPAGISTFGRESSDFLPHRTASAAGSRKGDLLAANFSPSPGTDKRGPTAVIKSHCSVDFSKLPCGTALDLKVLPSSARDEQGLAALVAMMRSFVGLGGIFMQIDVVDTELLRDAQSHPEKYPNLAVRISGWSARFATLTREWQDMVIQRSEQKL